MADWCVRAILDGRKTQTRRVLKPPPDIGACPYGIPGDLLYVKETCALRCDEPPVYRATMPDAEWRLVRERGWKIYSSRFMPRRAARIRLEITDLWIAPVQDITEADATAEGIAAYWEACCDTGIWPAERNPAGERSRQVFRLAWDALNAKRGYGWDANPLVWVVSFDPGRTPAGLRAQGGGPG